MTTGQIIGFAAVSIYLVWQIMRAIEQLHAELRNARAQLERMEDRLTKAVDHVSQQVGSPVQQQSRSWLDE